MTQIAWHYTIGTRASRILSDGLLKPATALVPDNERPIVWFSTRQHWEPTATKGIVIAGRRRDATMSEMIAESGLWRFGLVASELIPWGRLRREAHISEQTARDLIRAARRMNADPSFWYGSLEPVTVARCVVHCRLAESDDWGAAP